MGSDSWQGIDEDATASSLFLHGNSGVGKSSIVYACATMFNFTVIEGIADLIFFQEKFKLVFFLVYYIFHSQYG